jgi:hypothetical protein
MGYGMNILKMRLLKVEILNGITILGANVLWYFSFWVLFYEYFIGFESIFILVLLLFRF